MPAPSLENHGEQGSDGIALAEVSRGRAGPGALVEPEDRSAGQGRQKTPVGAHPVQRRPGEDARPAFRFVRIPEPFEILADHLDAEREVLPETPRGGQGSTLARLV